MEDFTAVTASHWRESTPPNAQPRKCCFTGNKVSVGPDWVGLCRRTRANSRLRPRAGVGWGRRSASFGLRGARAVFTAEPRRRRVTPGPRGPPARVRAPRRPRGRRRGAEDANAYRATPARRRGPAALREQWAWGRTGSAPLRAGSSGARTAERRRDVRAAEGPRGQRRRCSAQEATLGPWGQPPFLPKI